MDMLPPADRRPGAGGIIARLVGLLVASLIAGLVLGLMVVPFAGGVGVTARDAVQGFEALPDSIETPPLPQRTEILAADGSPLATLYYQNRVEVPLLQVAPVMRQAMVAVEDARFLNHNGVDVRGTLRALARNRSSGGVQEGASTP